MNLAGGRFRTKGDASCVGSLRTLHVPDIYMGSENKLKWNKNVSQDIEKSLSEHTGTMPATHDDAGLHTAGSISIECVSVCSFCPFAEDPELKDPSI